MDNWLETLAAIVVAPLIIAWYLAFFGLIAAGPFVLVYLLVRMLWA